MPKLTVSEERKQDFEQCPYTKRFINKKPQHKPLPENLTQGRIVIILSGKYAGKRAVYLSQLENGQLLVAGPKSINEVPLTAVPKRHIIITSESVKCNVDTTGFTYTMLCRPKGEKRGQEIERPYLNEWNEKIDKQLAPACEQFKDYLATPFTVRKQDKVHQFLF